MHFIYGKYEFFLIDNTITIYIDKIHNYCYRTSLNDHHIFDKFEHNMDRLKFIRNKDVLLLRDKEKKKIILRIPKSYCNVKKYYMDDKIHKDKIEEINWYDELNKLYQNKSSLIEFIILALLISFIVLYIFTYMVSYINLSKL